MIKLGSTSYKQTKFGILPREKVLEMEVSGTKKGLLSLNETIKINEEEYITGALVNSASLWQPRRLPKWPHEPIL